MALAKLIECKPEAHHSSSSTETATSFLFSRNRHSRPLKSIEVPVRSTRLKQDFLADPVSSSSSGSTGFFPANFRPVNWRFVQQPAIGVAKYPTRLDTSICD